VDAIVGAAATGAAPLRVPASYQTLRRCEHALESHRSPAPVHPLQHSPSAALQGLCTHILAIVGALKIVASDRQFAFQCCRHLAPLNKTLNPNLDKGVLQPTRILVKFIIIVGHGKFPPTTIHHP
jgi:hypothetical protein